MSFQLLPPEITSLQMYTGAGSGPMLAAAASWEGLCSELASAAQSFSSVTGVLPWQGAAAQAMTSVATQRLITAAEESTRTDLAAAGAAIGKGDVVGAARQVVNAGLVDAGTGVVVGSRTAFAPGLLAGEDLDILGGGSSLLGGMQSQAAALVQGGGGSGGSTLKDVLQFDQSRLQQVEHLEAAQIAGTQDLTKDDLSAASGDLSSGYLGQAADEIVNTGFINSGTGVQTAFRFGEPPLDLVGQDLILFGGGGGLKGLPGLAG